MKTTCKTKILLVSDKGMSIVGVMIATAMSSVLALGVAQIMSEVFKGQSYFKATSEIEYFHRELRARLNDRDACTNTFRPLGAYTNNVEYDVNRIMNEEPASPTVRYEIGQTYGGGTFRLTGMEVTYTSGTQPGVGDGVLEVQYEPTAKTNGPAQLRKRLINLRMNVSPGNNLTSCVVVGGDGGESHWKLSPTDNEKIFYDGKGIGVNTDDPAGPLDVRGGKAAAGTPATHIYLVGQEAGATGERGGDILLNGGLATGTGVYGRVGVNVPQGLLKASFEIFSTQENQRPWGANQGNGAGLLVGSLREGGDAPYQGMTTASGCRTSGNSRVGWCASMIGVNMYYDPVTDTMRRSGTDFSGGHNVAMGITMTSDGNQTDGNRMGFWLGPSNGEPVERLSLTNTGRLGIGVPNPTHTLQVDGTAGLSTGTAWVNTSDARLKDIHGDYEYGLAEILKLHTVRFSYKKGNKLGLPSDLIRTGFIAQEVQKVIPEAVTKRPDGILELNVDPIHWASLNAVQELHHMCKAQQKDLQDQVEVLKKENSALKAELNKVQEDLAIIKQKLGMK